VSKQQPRITPAEHLQAAMAAREQRQIERRAHLAKSREWAEERRKHAVHYDDPAKSGSSPAKSSCSTSRSSNGASLTSSATRSKRPDLTNQASR